MPRIQSADSAARRSDILWQRVDAAQLKQIEWQNEFVIFHKPSGKTHFLNGSGAVLLNDILNEPRSSDAAARELAAHTSQEISDVLRDQVEEIIRRLVHIGLVERS